MMAGAERKSMSATHMGITSRPAYLSHFVAAVPRRSITLSKAKFILIWFWCFLVLSVSPWFKRSLVKIPGARYQPAEEVTVIGQFARNQMHHFALSLQRSVYREQL